MTLIAAVISLFLFLAAKPVALLLLGPQFIPSVTIIQIMSSLPVLIVLSNIYGFQTMVNFGMQKEFRKILVFVGLCNIVILTALVIWFGACGAATASLIAEACVTLLAIRRLKNEGINLLRAA